MRRQRRETSTDESASLQVSLTEPLLSADNENLQDDAETFLDNDHNISPEAPSRNVTLTLLYTVFAFSGRSIWSQSVLATFVYILRDNDPAAVGYITAAMGLAQLLASFPTGIFADHYRRDVLLKLASVLGVMAIAVTITACLRENYLYLVASLSLWGLCWGVANTSLSALFADSIPQGKRSYYFTQRSILVTMGNSCGPIVGLILFCVLGDHWTVKECATVMALGQCVCFPAIVVLCFFDDKFAIQNNYGDNEQNLEPLNRTASLERFSEEASCRRYAQETSSRGSDVDTSRNEQSSRRNWDNFFAERRLPVLIAVADLISGLASGMSIRYFPIFFVDNLKLGPVVVQLLYVLSPLLTAVFMRTGQRLSTRFGRLHVVVTNKWIGVCFMLVMIAFYCARLPAWCVCAIYVARTAFMNCTGALSRSMLMDNVPKEERGKWSALESVNMFSWSGSAALGGVLVSVVGVLPLFTFTATLQFVATFPLIYLFSADRSESASETHESGNTESNEARNDVESGATTRAMSSATLSTCSSEPVVGDEAMLDADDGRDPDGSSDEEAS